jgi:hypothetical protein
MFQDLLKWGGKRPEAAGPSTATPSAADDVVVPSKALPKFLSALTQSASPVLVDFGPVIGPNVGFFGERLGCKLFIEDLGPDIERHIRTKTMEALPELLEKRFRHEDQSVDGLLCWDYFDFLDKASIQALARQIVRMLRPGGAVLGFFCTSSVARSGFTKYEIVDETRLRHRPHARQELPKTALQNRDIIRMFDGLHVSDSFLLKNNIREMLLRRR